MSKHGFQLALPRRERLIKEVDEVKFDTVSTRAPAKGATNALHFYGQLNKDVSTRAPAKGATNLQTIACTNFIRFNSRSREGSDLIGKNHRIIAMTFQLALPRRERRVSITFNLLNRAVSTRAPAKGATFALAWICCKTFVSTRAPAKGATLCRKVLRRTTQFQLALPRRERQQHHHGSCIAQRFQLALPRRERHTPRHNWVSVVMVSTRAPAKGATVAT